MTAEEFLDRLEEQGMLEEKLVASLRRQLRESKQTITAQGIAKLLTDKGQLTAFQAKNLLPASEEPTKSKPKETTSGSGKGSKKSSKWRSTSSSKKAKQKEKDQAEDVIDLMDGGGLKPLPPPPPQSSAGLTMLTEENTIPADGGLDGGGLGGPMAASDPLMDAALLESNPLMSGMASPANGGGKRKSKKVKRGQWDSPLMLVGGGILLTLVGLGIFLAYILMRGKADVFFQRAQDDYKNGSYSQAIERYNKYLKKFPRDKNVSLARVKRGLARLQLPVKSKNWPRSLKTAKKILPQIVSEDKFSEARKDLSGLLPDIAEGFFDVARKAALGTQDKPANMVKSQQLFDSAEEAMKLVKNGAYIPTSKRQGIEGRLERIEETETEVRRLIDQDKKLVEAVAAIRQAVDEGRTYDAYEIRKTLLQNYPGVEQHADLQAAVQRITDGERAQIKSEQQTTEAQIEEAPTKSQYSVVLARKKGPGIEGTDGRVAPILVRGSVYGLDAASGSVLWRRFVGYETTSHPQSLSRQKGGDALLVDRRRNELLRVELENGKLKWKQPIIGAAVDPIVAGNRIFVCSKYWSIKKAKGKNPTWWTGSDDKWSADAAQAKRYNAFPDVVGLTKDTSALVVGSGRLVEFDAPTGKAIRSVQFPQPLPAGPAYDAKRSKLYQIGEHSNVYVLSGDQLECEEVLYLGHKAGSIAVPPLATRGFLLVAENNRQNNSVLHVLSVDENGLSLRHRQDFPLKGHVVVPMRMYDNRVLVVTDLGQVSLLDVNSNNPETPVSVAAKYDSELKNPLFGYPLASDGLLWIADNRFTKFKIQAKLEQLNRQWIKENGTEFIAPLQKIGRAIIRVRQVPGLQGAQVTAVDIDEAQPLWETNLGSPLPGSVIADPARNRVLAVSASGDLFDLNQDVLQSGFSDSSIASVVTDGSSPALSSRIDLGESGSLYLDSLNRRRGVVYDPQTANPLRYLDFNISDGLLAGEPVAFRDGILVPTDKGQVYLLDLKTGKNLLLQNKPIHPFQPPLQAGEKIAWKRPVVVGDGDSEFIIADNRKRLFRVGVKGGANPHLALLKLTEIDFEIVSPLAAVGQTVYAVVRDSKDRHDKLVSWSLPDLSFNENQISLNGRFNLGPLNVDEFVFLGTDRGELHCLEAGGKVRWKTNLSNGPLADPPIPAGDDFLLISRSGVILLVNGQDLKEGKEGKELKHTKVDLGEPLAAGAVLVDRRLWLNGADGVIHVTDLPKRP